jgi:hypothetical protein
VETSIFERQLHGALIYLSKQRLSDLSYAELHLLSMTFGQSLAPRVCLCLPVKLVNSGDENVTSPPSRSYHFPQDLQGSHDIPWDLGKSQIIGFFIPLFSCPVK